jgi:hypothetical protein
MMLSMRHLAVLAVLASGCWAKMAVLSDPLDERKEEALIAPSLKLEIQGADLSTMGLYLAPNILPALQPPLVVPQAMPAAAPARPAIPAWLVEEAEAGNIAARAAIERAKETP